MNSLDNLLSHNLEDNRHLLPYEHMHTEVRNGYPDILFHWHPELEISYVHEGTARYHIDYDFFNSQSGDIILIRPNGMHSIHPIENKEHITDSIKFHLDLIGYYDIKNCLFDIFNISKEENRHFELLLKAKLNELLYLLYYHQYVIKKHTDDTYRKNERIRDLIDYINNNYQQNLTIEFLADYMGYSKTHFMTVFKQHTGTSCTEFIIQVRLNKASEHLINSTTAIIDIANSVGFNNLSNFNRQFKRYYHTTPRQYRKQFTNKKDGSTLVYRNINTKK